ncbi:MAG: hypothetical protein Q4E31_06795 [Intestinibacter bartlettii]|uniref:hypothetical protein n=1 Tax=Intestinibacter bartlettii TaxID=261299 RepID=UPI0026E9EA03|nr:hypothetical protein [Intestinibacter bartlettii]MDO5010519.1 hypothetical protein [Intestinibacter bartlettii]
MIILEFYFRTLTVLFWITLLFNWIFIPNPDINYYIFNTYLILSLIYIILAIINKIKHRCIDIKTKVDFFYKSISIITFVVSMMYFLLYSNSIKLLLIKTFIIFIYFYISCKKVNLKDEEGVVGIIGSILIFVFATYY